MSCVADPNIPPLLAFLGGMLLTIVIGCLIRLGVYNPQRDDPPTMRTADSQAMHRDMRRALHRANETPGPTSARPPPRPPPLDRSERANVGSTARAAAKADYFNIGRRRANPYAMHTQRFAWWAIEYEAVWTELAQHHGIPHAKRPQP